MEGLPFGNTWRLMIGVEVLPASLFLSLLFMIPESPRWFVNHKNKTDLIGKSNRSGLFSGKYNRALRLSFLMAFFNQFSGISFILFYAPEIFEKAGLGTSASLLSSISLGIINLIFTFAGIYLIDRKGRKQLMYIGTTGYIISLSMVALGFYIQFQTIYMLIFILLFIASHAIGQGAVIWVFIPEIFPNSVRPFGQAWGAGLLNLFAATIALLGSVIINAFSSWFVFAIFAFFMILQLLFVRYMMPETKGIPLEEIESKLVN